jgi:hypothetical protein
MENSGIKKKKLIIYLLFNEVVLIMYTIVKIKMFVFI